MVRVGKNIAWPTQPARRLKQAFQKLASTNALTPNTRT